METFVCFICVAAVLHAVCATAMPHSATKRHASGGEPNPPKFGGGAYVFKPTDDMADVQDAIDRAYHMNGGDNNGGQFSDARFAFMFAPGEYDVDMPVGYYTSVYGLGDSPDDVVFTGAKGVNCVEGHTSNWQDGALSTFWRSAENFKNDANFGWWDGVSGTLWAVSQASPLRRVHVSNDLLFFQYVPGQANAGYASGGYVSNSMVDGQVQFGSQQQFMTRNCQLNGGSPQGNWNMVYVGTENAPGNHCSTDGGASNVVVDQTPVVAEKPFITVDGDGLFSLNIPGVATARTGVDWNNGNINSADVKVPFTDVYVARNETDTADSINAKLSQGLHVVLSPGIYSLDTALDITTKGQVLLGLGFATLISAKGNAVITVADVAGVRIAGVLLQAGPTQTDVLLQVGVKGTAFAGDSADPVVLSDVFARVGGPDGSPESPVTADVMVQINSGNVVGDNFWLWRADHLDGGVPVTDSRNPCTTGIQVYGDDVTMYGLAVEHTLGDLALWDGKNGRTFFYQSELPYDVDNEQYGKPGFAGYRVTDNASGHVAYGVGVYHYFASYHVTVQSGIVAPESAKFMAPFSLYLNGMGTIEHVLNNNGTATSATSGGAQWIC